MPALATACWITDTMIQQRGDVLVVWQLPAIILSVLAIVKQERKQDRTLAVLRLLYAFILALFIGVIGLALTRIFSLRSAYNVKMRSRGKLHA